MDKCEVCGGALNERHFPNLTHGYTTCDSCSEKLQRLYIDGKPLPERLPQPTGDS